jgi:DNA-binding NtrC family response regulator
MHDKTPHKGNGLDHLMPAKPGKPALPLQNIRILVVEDEFILALDLQDFLESCGAIVIGPAASVEQALELANSESFSYAILDVHVAGQNIFPVAKLLTEKHIPFLFHTGHGDAEALYHDWPGCEVLMKPARYHRIIAHVVRMTDHAAPLQH